VRKQLELDDLEPLDWGIFIRSPSGPTRQACLRHLRHDPFVDSAALARAPAAHPPARRAFSPRLFWQVKLRLDPARDRLLSADSSGSA